MEDLEILSTRVKKIAENSKRLLSENNRLKLEVEFLRKEFERNRGLASESALLKRSIEEAAIRVERIMKKIDTARV